MTYKKQRGFGKKCCRCKEPNYNRINNCIKCNHDLFETKKKCCTFYKFGKKQSLTYKKWLKITTKDNTFDWLK